MLAIFFRDWSEVYGDFLNFMGMAGNCKTMSATNRKELPVEEICEVNTNLTDVVKELNGALNQSL